MTADHDADHDAADHARRGDPQTRPLTSLATLAAWTPACDPYSRCPVPLVPRHEPAACVRVCLCHDMAGGYKDDAPVLGVRGPTAHHCYSLQFWQHVHSFVYFSHERLSLPPATWAAAAHRNGVSVFATFIAEWGPGLAETLRLVYGPRFDPALPSTFVDFSPVFADQMVAVALHYGFDGWFVNIESRLPDSVHALVLARWLRYLTAKMRSVGKSVMWYDSVIHTGELRWQDRLSDNNKMFFDVCDSMFVNYTWDADYPAASAALAGDRVRDVYTGIDVWGRNTYGGGGFNAHKALRCISKAGTSCAIFAPAWTYESLGSHPDLFHLHERRFWCDASVPVTLPLPDPESGELPPTAVDSGDIGCVADYVPPWPAAGIDCFYSSFDQGFGTAYWIDGHQVSSMPWTCLSRQSIPPTHRTSRSWYPVTLPAQLSDPLAGSTMHVQASLESVGAGVTVLESRVTTDDAWTGGSSLELALRRGSASQSAAPPPGFAAVFEVFDVAVDMTGSTVAIVRYAVPLSSASSADGLVVALSVRRTLSADGRARDAPVIVLPSRQPASIGVSSSGHVWLQAEFCMGMHWGSGITPLTLGVVVVRQPVLRLTMYVGPPAAASQLSLQLPSQGTVQFDDVYRQEGTSDRPGRVWVTAKWAAADDAGAGRCEVWIDGVWHGSSCSNWYRFSVASVGTAGAVDGVKAAIRVVAYGAYGQPVSAAEGEWVLQ
ncbi:glycosyl hydrolase family 85-domain-containing protein [Entophlyctis helioformis]|nr:glycosyl hydrolase family 85-domain-containing protein [Entophlyctis helioformis]